VHKLRQAIDVEKGHINGIGKCVRSRREAAVTERSNVERGLHA